ncbi:MAG: glycosyltransferase family 39 protein [Candidatus Omnitrophica bacterium]|nr:glycosyltransferase family 39 protein [Candidatus Omnitrophota bacterium]
MRAERVILWLIAVALGIKLVLFLHIAFNDPASIIRPDSDGYLSDAKGWVQYFSTPMAGLKHSLYRTPGYSLFLAIFHFGLNLPLVWIIFLQLVLNILTAVVIFKIVPLADRRIRLLSAAIVLLDLPTTIYSAMILTESLHLFVLSLCLYAFVKYIDQRRIGWLAGAVFFLVASVYIRPVGYFLGFVFAGFVVYLWGIKKVLTGVVHAIVVLVLVYGFLGIWQHHNLKAHGEFTFSSIDRASIGMHGIIGRYAKETDPQFKAMPPVIYYIDSVGRNFLNLMTSPGNMKDFHSKVLRIFGVSFGYLFVVFWWAGCIFAISKGKIDVVGQFLIVVLLYFIAVSLFSTGWHVTPRFRIPMVPALAVLSARGWGYLILSRSNDVKTS